MANKVRKGETIMQSKLRIFGLLVLAHVLWTPLTPAAPMTSKSLKAVKTLKLRYVCTASWYGKQHQGLKMANGKRFDRHKLTAASWYFPLGTKIRVVNLKTGESVVCDDHRSWPESPAESPRRPVRGSSGALTLRWTGTNIGIPVSSGLH